MTSGDAPVPSASALRLVLAAERLFARHGIDGVSLRQIAAEAGSSNNSAVHYHFGTKHGLIAAIFRHRLPQIISERRLLAARCDPDDLRSRFEAHFLPVLTMAEATDNHYVSFIEQIQRMDLASVPDLLDLPADGLRSNEEFRRDLHRLLAHLDESLRPLRINEGQALCMHAAADRERAVASSVEVMPFEVFANSLFDAMAGFLAAPASAATIRRLRDAGAVGAARLRLL
ncbi:MAG: regulatory protein TetR [Acidimicrobiales bacterium]|nr:regulatory protein TetR [Acidimicrobiales bacterium]